MLALEIRGACQPTTMPVVTAASTPEAGTPDASSASAGRYAAYPLSSEIVISTRLSSSRRRISAITNPTASPISTPPVAPRTNSIPASHSEKPPPIAAAAATL